MPSGLLAPSVVCGARENLQGVLAASVPPPGFRSASQVKSAFLGEKGPFAPPRVKGSAAQRAGIRYERKAQKHLQELFGEKYQASPWFHFENEFGRRWCQPDGIFFEKGVALIVEIKIRSCVEAWWQIKKLYEPVVREALKPDLVIPLLVCKSFDPAVLFPEPVVQLQCSPLKYFHMGNPDKFLSYVWRP